LSTASRHRRRGAREAIGLLCALSLILPALAAGQPKAVVPGGLSFDFGTLYSTMKVKRLVAIRNEGTDTLEVSDVSTSCGCTAALISHRQIAPGDSGTIEVAFDPRKFSGAVEKGVSWKTNDPSNPKWHLVFTANVSKLVEVNPEYLIIRAAVGVPEAAHITISNMGLDPITILSVASSSPLIAFGEFEKTLRPSAPLELSLTFTAAASGAQNGDIVIRTDSPNVPLLSLRYFALVKEESPPPPPGGGQ
jgi:hypothetical protein